VKQRLHLSVAGLTLAILSGAPHAYAQSGAWPNKPIRMIVASGAGGGLDLVARAVGTPISESLGQTAVVDNRPGASGAIAAEVISKATPDGYTFMVMSASLVVYDVFNKTRYDLFRDFDAVTQISASPYMLTVTKSLPVASVQELIAYAKSNPGKLNFASTGEASLAHLAGELFASRTGTKLVHVPYKGVGAALPDMISGRTQMSFLSGGSVSAQIKNGNLKPLAVAGNNRAKSLPDVPTMIEAGVPGFLVTQWHGLMAPRGTQRAIIDRMHKEVVKAVQRTEVEQRLAMSGTEPVASSPKEFAAFLRSEREQWAKVAKAANIRPR
jgi:tripartite-type tricarboxylate transporter receptor subunit TctC